MKNLHFKDDILADLSSKGNVAQFMSFSPELKLRHFKLFNARPVRDIRENLSTAIERSSEKRVNVRSFDPGQPKGHPFVYGLKTADEVLSVLEARRSEGLHTIVNETIDTSDGGVSGVSLGNVIEFTPNDTPKGVDKPGVCSLPRGVGMSVLKSVYGFAPNLPFPNTTRIEFSIHPMRRGMRHEHTVLWELEEFEKAPTVSGMSWPNNFSKHIGDKVFGLLIAHHSGFKVPETTVFSRNVAPFTFGKKTGIDEWWIRTAPFDRTPGKYSTFFGWHDPFKLIADEDSKHEKIASVLAQKSVNARFSGSLITDSDNKPIIEGAIGKGDDFMVGKKGAAAMPKLIYHKVQAVFEKAFNKFGPIEMEWVFDGEIVWILQLHILREKVASGNVIYPGKPTHYEVFTVTEGLEALRDKISLISGKNIGITLKGNVGITSHFGDVLRKAKIPSLIIR